MRTTRRDPATAHGATPRRAARHRRVVVLSTIAANVAVLVAPTIADAGWTSTSNGTAWARAQTIPTAATPSVSVAGQDATVSWTPTVLTGGTPASGYVVRRYDGALVSQTVAADCAVVSSTSCVEHDVPAGTWTYSVQATRGGWSGPEGARSSAVAVYAAVFTITANQNVRAGTTVTGGALSGFAPNDPITFRLDSVSGTVLTASISNVDATGSASGFTVTIPAGSGEGAHTIVAVGASGAIGTSNSFLFDSVAPTHSLTLASTDDAHLSGGTLYFRRSGGGSFQIVDTLADSGSGPASAAFPDFTANRWTSGGGSVSTPLGGPFTSGVYSWTSNPATPAAQTITGLDAAGNSASITITFVSDDTVPTFVATDVKIAPVGNTTTTNWIGQGRQYYVYARPTDAGSGIGSVTADVRNVTTGLSAVPMVAGTYVVGGITYGWRTAALTANNPLGTGSKNIRATATDNVGNVRQSPNTGVVVENTNPTGSLTDPPNGVVGASVVVTATAADTGGSALHGVDFQFSPAGAGSWTTIAFDASAPFTTVWDTSALVDGASYDVRAVITDNAGNFIVTNVRTVTLDLPDFAPFAMSDDGGPSGPLADGEGIPDADPMLDAEVPVDPAPPVGPEAEIVPETGIVPEREEVIEAGAVPEFDVPIEPAPEPESEVPSEPDQGE